MKGTRAPGRNIVPGGQFDQLYALKRRLRQQKKVVLKLPAGFSFNRSGIKDFSPVLSFFDWGLQDVPVEVDFTGCSSANYQALSLLVLYCWYLKQRRCSISFVLDKKKEQSASHMWHMMGAQGVFSVSTDAAINFKGTNVKPLVAIRNFQDAKLGIERTDEFVEKFGIEYQKTLRYVLTELLYNALEHGKSQFQWHGKTFPTPSLLQVSWYDHAEEIAILIGDIGCGVQKHLSQAYPTPASEEEALRLAIQPEISGTFGRQDPYTNRNNAGMGLFLSSNIVRRLHADMHLISGNGVLHISPNDLTSRTIEPFWHGCFALVTVKLDQTYKFAYDQMMAEFRAQARTEVSARQTAEEDNKHYLSVFNYFGKNADDKDAAIRYRDRHLLGAVDAGKVLILDFDGVMTSTHSFLNALLASPIRRMGMNAFKRIKIVRAASDIRETLDYVLDDNTSPEGVDVGKYEPPAALRQMPLPGVSIDNAPPEERATPGELPPNLPSEGEPKSDKD